MGQEWTVKKMTRNEAVNWLINVTADIGKIEHRDLWHYEQALSEIKEMLEESADVVRCKGCKHYAGEGGRKKMNDLISRQAAIDAIRELESGEDFNFNNGLICAMNNVAELPSADAPQWIPCSERWPDPETLVLASYDGDDVEMAYYDGHQQYAFNAWMPLPEPWKGGEQDG